jgi:hypothetical protein
MKQDIAAYFVTVDESGKSEMDYFVEKPMDFGKDEVLPVCPEPPRVVKQIPARNGNVTAKRWVPTKPKALSSTIRARQVTSTSHVRAGARPPVRSMRKSTSVRPKAEKFIREDLRDEVSALEQEELALCNDDDFGMTFDLEL